MTKSTITRTWVAGLAVFGAGIAASLVGVFLMLAYGGTFAQVVGTQNYEFTPTMNGFFWMTVSVIVLGGLIALAGGVVELIAWIGALVNSYALPEKTWFAVLLIGGILSIVFGPIGFAVMVAYVVGAPDGEPYRHARQAATLPAAGPLAPTA